MYRKNASGITDSNTVKSNRYGGGRNAHHANRDAREAARNKYKESKREYEKLQKSYKTPEIVERMKVIKKQTEHWKRKMDSTGENHRQKPKGDNK